jgi:hypothetical protein
VLRPGPGGLFLTEPERAQAADRGDELISRFGGGWLGPLWRYGGSWHRGLLSARVGQRLMWRWS